MTHPTFLLLKAHPDAPLEAVFAEAVRVAKAVRRSIELHVAAEVLWVMPSTTVDDLHRVLTQRQADREALHEAP